MQSNWTSNYPAVCISIKVSFRQPPGPANTSFRLSSCELLAKHPCRLSPVRKVGAPANATETKRPLILHVRVKSTRQLCLLRVRLETWYFVWCMIATRCMEVKDLTLHSLSPDSRQQDGSRGSKIDCTAGGHILEKLTRTKKRYEVGRGKDHCRSPAATLIVPSLAENDLLLSMYVTSSLTRRLSLLRVVLVHADLLHERVGGAA
jgi:hypothetical protein